MPSPEEYAPSCLNPECPAAGACDGQCVRDFDAWVEENAPSSQWWSIHGDDLMDALKRCADGEQPGLVYAEMHANSDINPAAEGED